MAATSLTIPTPDLSKSVDYWTRLGFTALSSDTFTDGAVAVHIDATRTARTAIVLHEAMELVDALRGFGPVLERDGRFLASDPNGVLLWLDPDPAPAVPDGIAPAHVGKFSGMSIEAVDPVRTVAFWNAAGWEQTGGSAEYGWYDLSRPGCFKVSVMAMFACPHLFPNPGLTYFNSGKNPEVIAALRDAGVPIAEEIGHFSKDGAIDNVILADPGGTGFFVFND